VCVDHVIVCDVDIILLAVLVQTQRPVGSWFVVMMYMLLGRGNEKQVLLSVVFQDCVALNPSLSSLVNHDCFLPFLVSLSHRVSMNILRSSEPPLECV